MLRVRIDNYEISATKDISDNVYFKVIIDGQNIIHERLPGEFTRSNLIGTAMKFIETYNHRHGIEWGKVDYKSVFVMNTPKDCLHCEMRFVIHDSNNGKCYQQCGFNHDGYGLESFFKTEDLKENWRSPKCPLIDI